MIARTLSQQAGAVAAPAAQVTVTAVSSKFLRNHEHSNKSTIKIVSSSSANVK